METDALQGISVLLAPIENCASHTEGPCYLLAKVPIQPSALYLHLINNLKPPRTPGNSEKLSALFYRQTKNPKLYQVSCSRSNRKLLLEPKSPKTCRTASSSSCKMTIESTDNLYYSLIHHTERPCHLCWGPASGSLGTFSQIMKSLQ